MSAPSAMASSLAQAMAGSTVVRAANVANPQSVPAINVGKTLDALGDELGMLDEVRRGVDDARDEHLAFRQTDVAPDFPLVLVAWIRGDEGESRRPRLEDDVRDVGERNVAMVRPLVVRPAEMDEHALRRNARHRSVQRFDVQGCILSELIEALVGELNVPARGELGAVDL